MLSLVILTASCNKIIPAGFWANYNQYAIVTRKSNQGPYGGYQEVKWKSAAAHTFRAKQIIGLAEENNWVFTDSIKFSSDQIKKLSDTIINDTDYSDYILKSDVLSKTDPTDVTVYKFKTGWIAIKPDNDQETQVNGFAIINSTGTEMTAYHLWGE